jgi:hypothetical protein
MQTWLVSQPWYGKGGEEWQAMACTAETVETLSFLVFPSCSFHSSTFLSLFLWRSSSSEIIRGERTANGDTDDLDFVEFDIGRAGVTKLAAQGDDKFRPCLEQNSFCKHRHN